MSLPVFLAIIALAGLLSLVAVYKFIYLSYYAFQNKQQFNPDSQMFVQMREIIREELKRNK
jgi:ABC-type sugar transport system permease subunit